MYKHVSIDKLHNNIFDYLIFKLSLNNQIKSMVRKMRANPILFLCLILTASLVTSNLSVYNLQALEETDTTLLDIPYSIANYGFAP